MFAYLVVTNKVKLGLDGKPRATLNSFWGSSRNHALGYLAAEWSFMISAQALENIAQIVKEDYSVELSIEDVRTLVMFFDSLYEFDTQDRKDATNVPR